jgi:methylation protein EvaC
MKTCLICGNPIEPFISYGKMPIANGFIKEDEFAKEYFFEMKVAHCPQCNMVQLIDQPEREQMFNENYAFYSGTSKFMGLHFKEFAEEIKSNLTSMKDPFVVEIGSNDGIMLRNFKNAGIRHLGIEPSKNVAQVAQNDGINTITEFFDKELARKIVQKDGKADAFIAANVMCHIPYFHSIIEGIDILLNEEGIIVFEEPYLGSVLEKTTYDQIYDEHVFLFSLHSISYAFEKHGFDLYNAVLQETHGGSMRYYLCRKNKRKISNSVIALKKYEKDLGIKKEQTYLDFRRNCENAKIKLMSIIESIRSQGKRIVGYAATSKSTTIINYCGITKKHLDYICDTTPIKQGKFSPGAHIPVKPHSEFQKNYPDYALLFGYNHEKEIMEKEQEFIEQGGKWILYVPEIEIK